MIGMLAVHVGPEDVESFAGSLYGLAHGRASVLFVLLAGVGVALLSAQPYGRARARLKLLWFALLLLPLGLALELLDHQVAVILHHYAAFFLLGLCVLGLPTRWLFVLAVVTTVLGPVGYAAGRMLDAELFGRQSVAFTDDPMTVLIGLLISGPFPLLTWSAPLLWGIWLARQDLRSRYVRSMLRLLGASLEQNPISLHRIQRQRSNWRIRWA